MVVASGSQTVMTVPIQLFDELRSGIKLGTNNNITKILFRKYRVNMNDSCGEQIETQQITMKP